MLSAAGSVDRLAGQIARLEGAQRVVSRRIRSESAYPTQRFGFDAAFDGHDRPVPDRLREATPGATHPEQVDDNAGASGISMDNDLDAVDDALGDLIVD